MRKFSYFLMSLALTFGAGVFVTTAKAADAQVVAEKGKMLYATGGKRLGAVYNVTADGSAQVIVNGKLVTIPASTISAANGKLETSMARNEVVASR
jgi:hypothetical protein